jgi:hypothetical protein
MPSGRDTETSWQKSSGRQSSAPWLLVEREKVLLRDGRHP